MTIYIITVYSVFLILLLIGAFSRYFNPTLGQRIAFALFGIWAMWRITDVLTNSWIYLHEGIVATAFLIYSICSAEKTYKYWRLKNDIS